MHEILPKLLEIAKSNPDIEVCGVVGTDGEVYPIPNAATSPDKCFTFSRKEYFSLIKYFKTAGVKVAYVYHSHPNGNATPSKADKSYTAMSGVPQIIVCGNGKYEVLRRA